jgi:hypothetical protein
MKQDASPTPLCPALGGRYRGVKGVAACLASGMPCGNRLVAERVEFHRGLENDGDPCRYRAVCNGGSRRPLSGAVSCWVNDLLRIGELMAATTFQFPESFGDARVEELTLLSWAVKEGELRFASVPSGAWHDLLVHLVWNELLTVFSFSDAKQTYASQGYESLATPFGLPGDTPLVREMALKKVWAANELYEMRPLTGLRLTHLGRIRLSELKQDLRARRERDSFGILWDVRHWEQDVQIAILYTYPRCVSHPSVSVPARGASRRDSVRGFVY